jgi:hypothetical protein
MFNRLNRTLFGLALLLALGTAATEDGDAQQMQTQQQEVECAPCNNYTTPYPNVYISHSFVPACCLPGSEGCFMYPDSDPRPNTCEFEHRPCTFSE